MKFIDVVYVDDNKLNRFIVEKHLSQHFSIQVLESGEELYELLETYIPKVLILDWMMPNISGLEILKNLRSQSKYNSLIIMMLTAKSSKDAIVTCLGAGANDYIVKPPHYEEMIARINSLLKQREVIEHARIQNQLRSFESLLSGLTHEFNNIFAALKLSLQLYDLKGPEYFSEKLGDLQNHISRGLNLVQTLRELKQNGYSDFNPLILQDTIFEAIKKFKKANENQSRKVNITCDLKEEAIIINGNASNLTQAIFNVISNAHHATLNNEDRLINIKLFEKESEIILSVEDNGIGIEPEKLENLGHIFYTTKGALGGKVYDNKSVGTGLGLPATQAILNEHNASIDFQSVFGSGTLVSFKFKIPPEIN